MVARKAFLLVVIAMVLTIFSTSARAAYNMVMDGRVYQYSNYKAKKKFPVTLEVKVIKDNRPEYEKIQKEEEHPYTYDALWADVVDEMIEKVLEREFSQAEMVKSVDRNNPRSDYVLVIELNSFHGRWATVPKSFRPIYDIHGNTDFEARLISRKGDKILFKKNYKGRSKTQVSQFKNRYAYCAVEAGKAFKQAAVKLMADVETALSGGKVTEY